MSGCETRANPVRHRDGAVPRCCPPVALAAAQPLEKVPRVGVLHPRTRSDASPQTDAFLQGLRELGRVEGKSVVVEYRWADGKSDRLPDLVADLVRLKVDVILGGRRRWLCQPRTRRERFPSLWCRAVIP